MLLQSHHLRRGTNGPAAHREIILDPVRDIGWVTLEMAGERWDGQMSLGVAPRNDDTPATITLTEAA